MAADTAPPKKLPFRQRGSIAWMAGNSVAANLLMLVLLVGGLIWGTQIKQEVFPEFDLDRVTVSVSYPGASPEEVEQGILLAVEEAVQGLEGVKKVTAVAREGSGSVQIEMIEGADLQRLAQDIQSEVDRITTFPLEAEEPVVKIDTRRRQVITVAVFGDVSERVLRDTAEDIRDGLLQDREVTQVDLSGIRNLEIAIEVPQRQLRAYNLTLEGIAARVRATSVELPGGGLKTDGGEVLVRMMERRNLGEEFARIPVVAANDGTQVLLEDVAGIIDGFEDSDRFGVYNGKPSVLVDVYRVGEQTPMSVAAAVKGYLDRMAPQLRDGVELAILYDRSDIYQQRLTLLLNNGYLGLFLVFLLLGVFLELRLAFWVALGIPISFLGSLLFLPAMGVSINMISMFAFIVALGIVVDDAIVVGENIYKYRQAGLPALQAAIHGAREVAMPVNFSILTNIAAFVPLLFIPGEIGKIYKYIPLVVITVFIISLIESLFILPAHLAHQQEKVRTGFNAWLHERQQLFSTWFLRMVAEVYGPFLRRCLRQRFLVISLGMVLLALTLAYVRSGRLGMVLFPRIEADYAFAEVVLPYGSSVKKTTALQQRLIHAAQEVAEVNGAEKLVKGIYSEVGITPGNGSAAGGHAAQVRVYLTPPKERPLNTAEFVKRWRQQLGPVTGVESLTFMSDRGGPGAGASMTIELSHRDLDVLEAAAGELAESLAKFPNVKDIDDGFSWGKEQLDFRIRPEGEALGLTARVVAQQVRNSFYGAEALRQQRGRNEVKVMVRLPEKERISEFHLEELILRSSAGIEIPLREAVEVERGRAYTDIRRRSGRRVVSVTADVDPPHQTNLILSAAKKDTLPMLIEKYPGLNYSFEGRQADIAESMESLVRGLMLALLAIYALLAVPFRSYIQPAIVMLAIPFGIVGAVLGHWLMGFSLSVMSMLGVVALSGVVVNDSLMLIDFANRRREAGENAVEAIHLAAVRRFRPVLLTTLTTFGGLAPMIFETSRQARYLIPMALSLGFGVLFATLITLILVPCIYIAVEDAGVLMGAKSRFRRSSSVAPAVEGDAP